MAGKAPSSRKDRVRNLKPYHRPTESMISKMVSRVKRIVPDRLAHAVRNWMTSRSHNVESSQVFEDSLEGDKVSLVDDLPKYLETEPRYEISTATSAPFYLGPSTSRGLRVSDTEEIDISHVIPNCDGRKKDLEIVNGDDHSENSDNSASTSGCSSLISSQEKAQRSHEITVSGNALEELRGELMRKSAFRPERKGVSRALFESTISDVNQTSKSLWKRSTEAQRKLFTSRPSVSNRPTFNSSSYGKPSMSNSSIISSPFYDGATTFGGASAKRKIGQNVYNHDNFSFSRTSFRGKEKPVKQTGYPCINSVSHRILRTLEKMNTPISDAKKIPYSLNNPLALSPTSQRIRNTIAVPLKAAALPPGTPLVNLKGVTKLPFSNNSRINNCLMDIPVQKISQLPEESIEASHMDIGKQIDASRNVGGGKMKSNIQRSLRAHKQKLAPIPEEELSNISLKISSIPVFNMNLQKTVQSDKQLNSENAKSFMELQSGREFMFSEPSEFPKETVLQKKPITKNDAVIHFKFKEPIHHRDSTHSTAPLKANMNNHFPCMYNLSTRNSLKAEGHGKGKESDTKSVLEPKKSLIVNESVDTILMKMSEASEVPCKISSGNSKNAASDKSSIKATEVTLKEPSKSGFGNELKPKPGSWTCDCCLVQNEKNATQCIACSSVKCISLNPVISSQIQAAPTGFGSQFKPKEGSWECLSCMLRNESASNKCVACETERPLAQSSLPSGKEITESNVFKMPKSLSNSGPSNVWKCDTCFIEILSPNNKCAACKSLKEGLANKSTFASFKFGNDFETKSSAFSFGSVTPTVVPTNTLSSIKCENLTSNTPKSNIGISFAEGGGFKIVFGDSKLEEVKFTAPVTSSSADKTSETLSKPAEKINFSVLPSAGAVNTASKSVEGFKVSTANNTKDVTSKPIETSSSVLSNSTTKTPLSEVTSTTSVGKTMFVSESTKSEFHEKSVPKSSFGEFNVTPKTENIFSLEASSNKSHDTYTSSTKRKSSSSISPTFKKSSHSTSKVENPISIPLSTSVQLGTKAPLNFSTSAASAINENSTVGMLALFNDSVSSKPSRPPGTLKKAKELSSTSVSLKVPEVTKAADTTTTSSNLGSSQFSFATSASSFNNPFSSSFSKNKEAPTSTSSTLTTTTQAPIFTVPTTSSGFVFGNASTTFGSSTLIGSSTFGSSTTSTSTVSSQIPGVFRFGAVAATKPSDLENFSFKPSSSKKQLDFSTPGGITNVFGKTASTFQFGTPSSSSSSFAFSSIKPGGPPATGTFNFAGTGVVATTMPSFSFGNHPSGTTTVSGFKSANASGFSFATKTSNENTDKQTPLINPSSTFNRPALPTVFGNSGASTAFGVSQPGGGFNFGTTVSASPAVSTPFVFGSHAEKKPTSGVTQASGFSFAMARSNASNNFSNNFNVSAPPSFNFGASSTPTNQPFHFAATTSNAGHTPPPARKYRKAIRRGVRREN